MKLKDIEDKRKSRRLLAAHATTADLNRVERLAFAAADAKAQKHIHRARAEAYIRAEDELLKAHEEESDLTDEDDEVVKIVVPRSPSAPPLRPRMRPAPVRTPSAPHSRTSPHEDETAPTPAPTPAPYRCFGTDVTNGRPPPSSTAPKPSSVREPAAKPTPTTSHSSETVTRANLALTSPPRPRSPRSAAARRLPPAAPAPALAAPAPAPATFPRGSCSSRSS